MTIEPQYRTIDLVTIGLCIKNSLSEADANTLKSMHPIGTIDLETVRVRAAYDMTNLLEIHEVDQRVLQRTLKGWLPSVIRPEHVYREAAHEYISVALEYAREEDRARMERSLLFSLGYAIKGQSPMEFIQSQHEFVRTEYRKTVSIINVMMQATAMMNAFEDTEEDPALKLIGQDTQPPSALSSPRIDMRRFNGDGGFDDDI